VPGDPIVGYLGRGEGLVVHMEDCAVGRACSTRTASASSASNGPTSRCAPFETTVLVTVANGKGVLARVAAALANAEADITHVDMDDDRAQDATDLRFVIAVRDRAHLDAVLRNLKRTPSVMNAQRLRAGHSGG
jgi:guanosine-3',5'-bis(diphosphate) 3'-pyrophosphohydrolase